MALRAVLPRTASTWARASLSVVLPAVPVTHTTLALVLPRQSDANRPRARTVSSTRSAGTPISGKGREASTAAAPRATALAAKSWPSTRSPGTQTKSAPGRASRLSVTTQETTASPAGAAPPVSPRQAAISIVLRRNAVTPAPLPDRCSDA